MATAKKATTAKKKGNEMDICAGLDLGNGWTKGLVKVLDAGEDKASRVDLPSCVSYVPAGYKWTAAEPTDQYMEDLVNKLDCEIKTPIIPEIDRRRMLVGERAAALSTSLIQFNIDNHIPKCDDPLSIQLTLAVIAAEAVASYWKAHGELPDASLQVTVDLGVALPFVDYIKYRQHYADILEENKHTVHIYNFSEDGITCNIVFSTVSILAESAAGQYAITELGSDFLDKAIALAKEDGLELDDEVDGEHLVDAENVVTIDVGAGNVGFALFLSDGEGGSKLEPAGSSSINKGVGTALENVLESTRSTSYEMRSRKELEKLLQKENPTPGQRALAERLSALIEEEMDMLARDITAEYTRVIAPVKLDIEAVYVIGGGANIVRDALYDRLVAASDIAGTVIPIVFLDSAVSRHMNANGLYMLAEMAHENNED